jgi:hypothetical protein
LSIGVGGGGVKGVGVRVRTGGVVDGVVLLRLDQGNELLQYVCIYAAIRDKTLTRRGVVRDGKVQ